MVKKIVDIQNGVTLESLGIQEQIDIAQLIKNHELFARRIDHEQLQVQDGALYSARTIELGEGRFTNFYDLSLSRRFFTFEIVTSETETSGSNLFKAHNRFGLINLFAVINAGFFFLTDDDPNVIRPKNANYNLHISRGLVRGLSAVDRPAAMVIDGKFEIRNLRSRGTLRIGSQLISWRGSKSTSEASTESATLYNSSNCTLRHVPDLATGTRRKVDLTANFTPKNHHVVDIVIDQNYSGELEVIQIQSGGGSNFFSGACILQLRSEQCANIRVGDAVKVESIDDIYTSEHMISSAITVGPSVFEDFSIKDSTGELCSAVANSLRIDRLLCGDKPNVGPHIRNARSIIWEDTDGAIHFSVLDGAPRSQTFTGVTFPEVAKIITPEIAHWAFHMDGGQSSHLLFLQDKQIMAYGNFHHARWPVATSREVMMGESIRPTRYLLNYRRGRPAPSFIVARRNTI